MSLMNIYGIRTTQDKNLDHPKYPYEMGIELELEDCELNHDTLFTGDHWTTHDDASLRRGVELVSRVPISGDKIGLALDTLYKAVLDFTAGPRTSTHIHLNVSSTTDDVVSSMFFLMYFLEEGVYAVVEESRKWAGYSMPLREMSTTRIRNILTPQSTSRWHQGCTGSRNSDRYYGFNTNWSRHGTVEFRYFPGGPTREELELWLQLPVMVRRVAEKYTVAQLSTMFDDPTELCRFIRQEFAEWGALICDAVHAATLFGYYQEVSSYTATSNAIVPLTRGVVALSPSVRRFFYANVLLNSPSAITSFEALAGTQELFTDELLSQYCRMSFGGGIEVSPYGDELQTLRQRMYRSTISNSIFRVDEDPFDTDSYDEDEE